MCPPSPIPALVSLLTPQGQDNISTESTENFTPLLSVVKTKQKKANKISVSHDILVYHRAGLINIRWVVSFLCRQGRGLGAPGWPTPRISMGQTEGKLEGHRRPRQKVRSCLPVFRPRTCSGTDAMCAPVNTMEAQ